MQEFNFDVPDADERGVSPVIGVILMVAVTAILASIIAAFLFGFPAHAQENAMAGSDVSVDDHRAQVTWVSEGNADELRVRVTNASGASVTTTLDYTGDFVTVEYLGKDGGLCSPHSGQVTANSTELTVVVTAVSDDAETVVRTEHVDLD